MEPIRELIAVDLEMTGLQVKTDRILEIGAVRLVDGQLRDTFQTFVNPHRRIDARITELTGIWPEMVENAPEAEEALRKFLEFAGEAPFLGHNVIFDYSFLKQCAVNHKISLERSALDTLKIARKVLKEPEKKSLEALCGYFQIDREHAHRAVDDAKATAELFLMLQQKYQQQEPGLCREGGSGRKSGMEYDCCTAWRRIRISFGRRNAGVVEFGVSPDLSRPFYGGAAGGENGGRNLFRCSPEGGTAFCRENG